MKTSFKHVVAAGLALFNLTSMGGPVLDSYWPLNGGDQKTFVYDSTQSLTMSVSSLGGGQFSLTESYSGASASLILHEDQNSSSLAMVSEGYINVSFDPVVLMLDDDLLQNGGTVKTSTTVTQPGISYPATFTVKIANAGTVTVPGGTFENCRSITTTEVAEVPGHGTMRASALTAYLAPGVGIIKTLVTGGHWAELVSGTVAGVPVGKQGSSQLTVQINGAGAVQINGVAGVITAGDSVRLLQIGQSYTATAKVEDGSVFAGWTDNRGDTLGTAPKLTFTMQSNLVLEASFVPNPFAAPAGVYSGLFAPASGATVQNSGFIALTVTIRAHSPGICRQARRAIPSGASSMATATSLGTVRVPAKIPGRSC